MFPTKNDRVVVAMPGVAPTLIVAVGLMGFGVFILIKLGLLNFELPAWLNQYGLWAIASIFILRAVGDFNYVGFFKKHKQTKFGQNDTKYYSPLCLTISLLILFLIVFI